MALSGPRTLLMQAAHPVAFAGFFAHTGALDEPYERLSRTAQVMNTIGWGTRADADRATRRVRAMHRRVRGTLQRAGRALPGRHALRRRRPRAAAVGPRHASSTRALVVYQKYVGRLTPRGARGLLAGLQADRPPVRAARRRDAGHASRTSTPTCTPWSRATTCTSRRGRASSPSRSSCARPCPLQARPLLELVNQITVGLLPGDIRRQYGLSWDPARSVALHGGRGVRPPRARPAAAGAAAAGARRARGLTPG